MKIGEITEVLIGIIAIVPTMSQEEQALIETCNLLDRLPGMEEATAYEPAVYCEK